MSRRPNGNGAEDGQAIAPTVDGEELISAAPPRALSDIPGLGPIRVRALQKAGWTDLSALRSADVNTLLTVPGLSEIKARHIQQYLASFTPDELSPRPPLEDAMQLGGAILSRALGPDAPVVGELAAAPSQLVQRATRAMGEVVTALLSPDAPQFRSRLLRILGQLAQAAESLATDAPHLSDEQRSRAIRRLRRAGKALSEFNDSAMSDRKAQGRLADVLEELIGKLAECRLSS